MTRAAVLFTGAIALALVARAASVYRGGDPLAYGLVLLIGAGLVLGVLELLVRAGRAERLTREVLALPAPATPEVLKRGSPEVRALLEARIAGAHGASIAAPFTPYLLGLLVMIGLLGTFLGLFETLRGAREALSASGDVAALRSGLAAPMAGLSRAFGTSAAGVSASAMLGLGSVFVRRAEARFVNALNRYAAGPLAPLSIAARTLAALEAIAARSEALPEATRALREATGGLTDLEAKLRRAQEESAAATGDAIRGAAGAIRETAALVRGDLGAAIERAAAATQAAVAPLLEQAAARAGVAAREELGKVVARLEARAREDEARDGRLDALVAKLDTTAADLAGASAAQAATLKAFAEAAAQRALEGEARAEARAAALTEHARRTLDDQAGQLAAFARALEQERGAFAEASAQDRTAFAEQLAAFSQRLERDRTASAEQLAGFTKGIEQEREASARQLAAFTRGIEQEREASARQLAAFTRDIEQERAASAEQLASFTRGIEQERATSVEQLAERLTAHARELGTSFDATAALVRDASDLLRAGSAEMSAVAEMFTLAVDRYREASDRWLKNLGVIEDAIGRQGNGEAADLFGAYLDQTREVFDHALQFQRELFSELRALRNGGGG